MAIIKHIAIKNSSYTAAVEYLSYKHDEFTNKPILDEYGNMILRDSFLLEGINCSPQTYGIDCMRTNEQFGKNHNKSEIKAHHYIISFDPRDRDENGLNPEHAQELGMAFAHRNFPGHQILVCTHPDGHNSAGNIHIHIVLNSVRAFDVPHQDFMERPGDALAGHKHHVTKDYLEYLKQQTMEMCQQEKLNQVDLLHPAKVRITDREYWAQRRGQKKANEKFAAGNHDSVQEPPTYETKKMVLRRCITDTIKDASAYQDFQKKLFENYGISVHESRGQIGYILPDKIKPIRGRSLGTDFEKPAIMRYLKAQSNPSKSIRAQGEKSGIFPEKAVPEYRQKSLRLITDLETCIKAQQSKAYAQKVKIGNLQQMSASLLFLQKQGIGSMEELDSLAASSRKDFDLKSSALKATEGRLRQINKLIHSTGQYLSTKAVHSEYLKSKNKKDFRKAHASNLSIYDSALKELRTYYGEEKFMTIKQLKEKKAEITSAKNEQYEAYCFARSKHREIQIVTANVHTMLDQKPENTLAKEQNKTQAIE